MSNFGYPSAKDRIDSGAPGRVCAAEGCDTILSRFNKTERCGVHEEKGVAVPAERDGTALGRPQRRT
jgi:hypothetical protein